MSSKFLVTLLFPDSVSRSTFDTLMKAQSISNGVVESAGFSYFSVLVMSSSSDSVVAIR